MNKISLNNYIYKYKIRLIILRKIKILIINQNKHRN